MENNEEKVEDLKEEDSVTVTEEAPKVEAPQPTILTKEDVERICDEKIGAYLDSQHFNTDVDEEEDSGIDEDSINEDLEYVLG